MISDAHTSEAHALIRETSQLERSLTERELRGYLQARSCHFLAKFTGLPYQQVVEIYEQEQQR